MNKDTIQIWCAYVGCLFFLAWGIIRYNKGTYEMGEKVHKNLGFAIGTFRKSITGGLRIATENLYFDFNTNEGQYKNVKYEGIQLNKDKAIPGNKYLVIYNTKDPQIATMLFVYPIKDSLDYQRYMKEFERKPLDITPYYRTPYAKHWLKDYSDND